MQIDRFIGGGVGNGVIQKNCEDLNDAVFITADMGKFGIRKKQIQPDVFMTADRFKCLVYIQKQGVA
ncbi:MAG: hypothetical protein KH696_09585, partial [Sutterella sp.]|nr:hypothetical protein [Sutterella sp.]